jgi:hypothetical protein
MATRKSSKKTSTKSSKKGAQKRPSEAAERTELDKHPRPEEGAVAAQVAAAEAASEAGAFASTVDDLDRHPRPAFQQATVAPPLAQARAADAERPALSQPACTRSSISTTGSNGDERDFPTFIGNFHKGLPHDQFGEVDQAAYKSLLKALNQPTQANFAAIQLGLGRKLTNPQSGLSTDLEGPDPKNLKMRSAPKLNSAEEAAEAVEDYWMALLRDVPFTQFDTDTGVAEAAQELSGLTDFTGPKIAGRVTPRTIFRGCSAGAGVGPYLSQFMLKDIPYGSLEISQRQKTVLGERVLGPGNADYLTKFPQWLAAQNGSTSFPPDQFDGTRRYIRNMRDLGQYVHVDALYEAYLNACLILLGMGAPEDDGNPYKPPNIASRTQIGFGTFGGPHILSLVCEVATRALKAVWYQKWFVHRRLRPEAYGGLVHLKKTGTKPAYPIHPQVLNSQAVNKTFTKFGSYLMPMAFPEGSPTHPAYGAGHATVAGACVTVLKAWFDENALIPNPVVPTADGTALVPYTGADANRLTVGGELNKVAANIAIGRNMAGVHWRSDYFDSVRLGERVAICILFNQRKDYNEDWFWTFTSFDGETVKISKDGITRRDRDAQPCKDRDKDVL